MAGSITDRLSSDLSVFPSTILWAAVEGKLRVGDMSTINQVLGCLFPELGTAN